MLKLKRPLVFFDLETTGVDVKTDRIVQMAIVRMEPGEDGGVYVFEKHWLLNPQKMIPAMATAVHGITNEAVAGLPAFGCVAEEIMDFFHDADVCGYNIDRFDIPLLMAEFERAGFPDGGAFVEGAVIDTMKIFQARFRHTLECAHRLYVGEVLEGAHDAMADAVACRSVLIGMLNEYPDLPREPEALAKAKLSPDYVDREGKFIWLGDQAVFSFGEKTRNRTLREVAQNDRGFLQWMLTKDFPPDTLAIVRKAMKGEFPQREDEQC